MSEFTYKDQRMITYHQDGLLDIYIGISLLVFGLSIFTGNVWLGGVIPAVLIPTWISSRNSLLKGRLRDQELYSDKSGLRLVAMTGLFTLTALAGLVVFMAVLLISDWNRTWIAQNMELMLGLGGALLLAIIGLILSARRLYAYALLAVIIFVSSWMFGGNFWLPIVALGTSITLAGLVVLLRFLSTHPRSS